MATLHTLYNLLNEYHRYWFTNISLQKYLLPPQALRRLMRYGPKWCDNIKTDLQGLG
jgi:hypothetical protein